MIVKTLVLVALALLPLGSQSITIKCEDYDRLAVATNLNGASFEITNDVWGDPNGPHTQCVFTGGGSLGWRWNKPQFTYKPYFPHMSLDVGRIIHARVSYVSNFQVILSSIVRGTGTYNLAFDIWFTSDPQGKQVTDELMIWMVWTNRTIKLPTVVSDGSNQYAYLTYKAGWRFHAFILLANTIPFTIDFKRLMAYTGITGYLKSISLGNEVFSGTGETIIYAINIMINDISIRNSGACYDQACLRSYSS